MKPPPNPSASSAPGLDDDYDPRREEHVDRPYRFRLRAIAEELDRGLGPHEHAALYFDASGARRVAVLLRRKVAAADHGGSR